MNLLETAHSEKVYTEAEVEQLIREAGFATEPHRQLIDRAKQIIEYYSYDGYNNRSIQQWLRDAEKALGLS